MAHIHAKLIDQYKFNYPIVFSANFNKEKELVLHLRKLFNLLVWSDINDFDLNDHLKAQIENLEIKNSGWRFDKVLTMTIWNY